MSDNNNDEVSPSAELSVSEKGLTAKGDAYEDLRPLIKAGVAVGTPILLTIANTLAIGHGWINVRLQGVADRYSVKLLEIPENKRQLPPPEISASVISRAIYAEDDPALHELFAELLTSASDSTRTGQAHVAFATMISELEPLDAKILTLLKASPHRNELDVNRIAQTLGMDEEHETLDVAYGNLKRLELVESDNGRNLIAGRHSGESEQEKLTEVIEYIRQRNRRLKLTALGKRFVIACLPEEKAID